MLCRVEVKSEQMSHESFAEYGKWFRCHSLSGVHSTTEVPKQRRVATSLSGILLLWWCSRANCAIVKRGALQCSGYAATVLSQRHDQRLEKELCRVLCEERPDPVDAVEGKSAGSGHSSDVWGAGQYLIDDNTQVHHRRWTQYHDTDWQFDAREVFPKMKRSSVLLRLRLRWCAECITTCASQRGCWSRIWEKRGTVGYRLHNSGKRIHVMW